MRKEAPLPPNKPFHRIGGKKRPPPSELHVVRQRDEIQVNTLPACRNGMLFDNSLNDKRFRIDIRVENGYEEGCKQGANKLMGQDFCGERSCYARALWQEDW